MDKFSELKAFVSVVELGSFSAAADQLCMTKSSISKKVSALERRLSVKLLNRTTRRLSITEPGKVYYCKVKKIIQDCDEADSVVSQDNEMLKGILKITAAVTFSSHHLNPVIKQYMEENENISLNISLSDNHVNLVEEGVDLAIRIGVLPGSGLMTKRLAPIKRQLYASPDYIKKHGCPEKPKDLIHHTVLNHTSTGRALCFIDKDGNEKNVYTSMKCSINSGDMLVSAVANGQGIAVLSTYVTYKECNVSSLVPIMLDYSIPEFSLYAVYPQTQYLPYKVRKLIELLEETFGETPYWDVEC